MTACNNQDGLIESAATSYQSFTVGSSANAGGNRRLAIALEPTLKLQKLVAADSINPSSLLQALVHPAYIAIQ
jgi:hypothetical protein